LGIIEVVMNATSLDQRHQSAVRALLHADPVANIFPIGVFERWGLAPVRGSRWWGFPGENGELSAVLYSGPTRSDGVASVAVAVGDQAACESLGRVLAERGGAAWVVGERTASDALWVGLGSPPMQVRSEQILMQATTVTAGAALDCRAAQASDWPWVCSASDSMIKEEMGVDSEALSDRVMAGEYVGSHDARRVYRARVATRCSAGVQIGGVWVDPSCRRRGMGTAGTRGLTRQLLERHPRVTLHVRTDNESAIRCYEAVGFAPVRAFRVLVR
jgi:hypothetical protein